MLKRSRKLIQAYGQTPWRRQMQMIGFFAAAVASLALLAGLYLNVSARSATAGRRVQDLQDERAQMEQQIENLETELAFITSVDVMQQRAKDLGFSPLQPGTVTYLSVPGYRGIASVQLAPRSGAQFGAVSRLPAAYTQSIFDWMAEIIGNLGGL